MSSRATQANRPIRIDTPLGEDVLLLQNFTLKEELARPFELRLDLQSENSSVDFNKIVGQKVTVTMDLPNRGKRYLNGYVTHFAQNSFDRATRIFNYRAMVRPWLSLLDLSSDCRIFQSKTVPAILKELFTGLGFSDFRDSLTGSYSSREFCVQYRETAFQFASRLMEQEGIAYHFEHQNGSHILVLCDSPSAYTPYPGYESLGYTARQTPPADWDHISEWVCEQELRPGSCTLTDYDYSNPKAILRVSTSSAQETAQSGYEYFDAPGFYQELADGETYVRVRLEEMQCRRARQRGEALALGLCAGSIFQFTGFSRDDQNASYLITSTQLEVTSADFSTNSSGSGGLSHRCAFETIRREVPFRPERRTPKPIVHGPQTAVVTGPAGQDGKPYTSAFGSVKVLFRWDRHSQPSESSSIWVRVSQISAGQGWGSMFIPRVGNEVIVSFEEGDPDRPVITGRLYNGMMMPPLSLPSNALKSYISDDGVNAICWNPEQGAQCVMIYSPHNNTLHTIGAGHVEDAPTPEAL